MFLAAGKRIGQFGAFPRAEVADGQTLTLTYRFLVLAGPLPDRDESQEQYQRELQRGHDES
jgi:hypothetical protein